ncbi:hypothetical protein GA707_20540, partial [Nostocoides sp. F2B08]|uniref:hypothetical protein n=1 Tax=Nostocoides sp. F2B08 TaxID=2653936 RepID=UPI001263D9AB
MATERAVLIRYQVNGKGFVGSGLRVRDRFVLTADHCAQGTGHQVQLLNGSRYEATVHVRSGSAEVDLAVLALGKDAPTMEGLGAARVDRAVADSIRGCQALGFPRWRRNQEGNRILAQVDGAVPTGEGLRPDSGGAEAELLELKGTGPSVREHPTSPGELVQGSPWGGMSGAAVVVNDLVLGVVRSHNLAAGSGSLTVTPLSALTALPDLIRDPFVDALGLPDPAVWPVLPDRVAELSRAVLRVRDATDHPPRVMDVDAGVFGARKARTDLDLHGDPYYPYVTREVDEQIRDALDRRVDGSDMRMLLLVGEAMAGKSRTGAHTLQAHPVLQGQPLLIPRTSPALHQVTDLIAELIARQRSTTTDGSAQGAVLWLDDLNEYFAWLTEDLATTTWRAIPNLTVVATIRRGELATLQGDSDMRATWEFLNNKNQVEKIPIESEWSTSDQAALTDAPDWVRTAVAEGTPLGELLGSARELLAKLENAAAPMRALVEVVVDWQRTGIPDVITEAQALELWAAYLPRRDAA